MPGTLGIALTGIQAAQFDPDALSFINSAGITSVTERYAINNLVTDLKLNSLWTKLDQIYPFAGSSGTSNSYNLKNPLVNQLVFNGGWTHSSTGALANGTNAYASTGILANSLDKTNAHLSLYQRINYTPSGIRIDFGAFNETTFEGPILATEITTGTTRARLFKNALDFSATDNRGFFLVTTNASNAFLYKSGTQVATIAASGGTQPAFDILLGAITTDTGIKYYSPGEYAFASIGSDLTENESLTLTSIVQRYQNSMGRAIVAIPTVQDINAQNFLVAAGITDNTQAQAVQNLTAGLKYYSLWDKLQAIYPFAGSTSTTQKFNLKSPFNTDAAFRLVFNGGWTHSSTGALPNGTNAFADTKFIASTSSNLNDAHFSIYSRTAGAGAFQNEFGVANANEQRMVLITRWTTNDLFADLFSANQRVTVSPAPTTTGLFTLSRNTSTEMITYRNGSQIGINTSADGTAALPTIVAYLSAFNNAGVAANFSSKELAFATIGSKLATSTENSNFYTVVQAYQTALSRNV